MFKTSKRGSKRRLSEVALLPLYNVYTKTCVLSQPLLMRASTAQVCQTGLVRFWSIECIARRNGSCNYLAHQSAGDFRLEGRTFVQHLFNSVFGVTKIHFKYAIIVIRGVEFNVNLIHLKPIPILTFNTIIECTKFGWQSFHISTDYIIIR